MASSRTIGRLVVAGILVGVVLWSAGPGAADPMRLRLENLTTGVGVVITDNGSGDLDPVLGSIIATPTLGGGLAASIQAVVTPQPETMVLLGMGLIALALLPVLGRAARRQGGA